MKCIRLTARYVPTSNDSMKWGICEEPKSRLYINAGYYDAGKGVPNWLLNHVQLALKYTRLSGTRTLYLRKLMKPWSNLPGHMVGEGDSCQGSRIKNLFPTYKVRITEKAQDSQREVPPRVPSGKLVISTACPSPGSNMPPLYPSGLHHIHTLSRREGRAP